MFIDEKKKHIYLSHSKHSFSEFKNNFCQTEQKVFSKYHKMCHYLLQSNVFFLISCKLFLFILHLHKLGRCLMKIQLFSAWGKTPMVQTLKSPLVVPLLYKLICSMMEL
ncbi:hypothetical protein GOODEAATRI_027936 [Goodea atripinnis]|uniref:Maturase K n=1 Tax=Goodea atripinnis TaxID=208336 RepID=A0ABV0N549_9TELE